MVNKSLLMLENINFTVYKGKGVLGSLGRHKCHHAHIPSLNNVLFKSEYM